MICESNAGIECRRTVAVADGDQVCTPASRARAITCSPIGVELLAIEMCVRIDEHRKSDPRTTRRRASANGLRGLSEVLRSESDIRGPTSEAKLLISDRAPTGTSSQKACQHGLSAVERRRNDHPVRFHGRAAFGERGWPRSLPCGQSTFLRRISLGDAGQNLPHFRADVDFQPQQFVRFGHSLGNFHHAPTRIQFWRNSSI